MASTGRAKRKTAGRRMNALVGEAQEQDDAFWGHDTWAEDDSDNDSFRESDEDSALGKDEFDSDFDDSEIDNEDEEAAAGEAAELELQKSERAAKHARKGGYVDKKAGPGGKKRQRRIMGEGSNTGLVLRFPPHMTDSFAMQQELQQQQQQQPSAFTADTSAPAVTALFPQSAPSAVPASQLKAPPPSSSSSSSDPTPMEISPPSPTKKMPPPTKRAPKKSDPVLSKSTLVSTRERRSTHGTRKLRDTRSTPAKKPTTTPQRRGANQHTTGKTAKRRRYTQEELLIEAVQETEPENKRWLLARKRVQDQNEKEANANALRNQQRGKVIEKFHSRRGCLITLTFPDMDAIPEILTRRPQQQAQAQLDSTAPSTTTTYGASEDQQAEDAKPAAEPKKDPTKCVITGKPAKYRDPLTKQPYYDLAAFKELRRRHNTKTPINKSKVIKAPPPTASSSAATATAASTKDTKPQAVSSTNPTPAQNATQQPAKKKVVKKSSAKSTTGKKTAPPSSKLPFQSPKPDPKQASSTAAGHPQSTSNGTTAAKPDASLAHLAFSWGSGGTPGQSSTESPVSPSGRRLSRRKWKPSEKVLQTIAMSPKKDGITNTPPGLITKPQQALPENIPMMPPPPVGNASSATSQQQVNVKSKNAAGSKSSDKVPGKRPSTAAKKKLGATKTAASKNDEHPSNVAKTAAAKAAAMSPPASATKRTDSGTLKIPSPELAKQLQKVYVVPANGGGDTSAPNGDSAENAPQYITQGDLINQVIDNYTKQHEVDETKKAGGSEENGDPKQGESSQAPNRKAP